MGTKSTGFSMRKSGVLFCALFAVTATLAAQESDSIDVSQFVAVYDYNCHTLNADGAPVTEATRIAVQVGKKTTKSQPYNSYLGETGGKKKFESEYYDALAHVPTVWMDYPAGLCTTQEELMPDMFEGSEKKPSIDWKLQEDTLTWNGYHCNRATALYAGVQWSVWYTQEVPSAAGPWKLQGLPGLIVWACDGDSVHSFALNNLTMEEKPIYYFSSPDIYKMDNSKLVKYRNKILCNKEYALNPTYYVPDIKSKISHSQITVLTMMKDESGKNPLVFINNRAFLMRAHLFKPIEM